MEAEMSKKDLFTIMPEDIAKKEKIDTKDKSISTLI